MRLRSLLVLFAIVPAFYLSACSKQSSAPPKVVGDTPVAIVATDSGFTIPDTLHAGLNHIVYENHGNLTHECMFIQLPAGMTPADYVAQVKADVDFPPGAKDCSGSGLVSPGEKVELWVSLEEGNYMLGCWVGNHLTTRKPTTFVVHGNATAPVTLPHEDLTVRLIDYRFELSAPLKRGDQVIRYQTVGPSMHEADIVRLADGRTVDDVRQFFKTEREPAPGIFGGGILDSHDITRVTWVRRHFEPGRYVFWCEMPMVQNAPKGAPHLNHADAGMFKEVTID